MAGNPSQGNLERSKPKKAKSGIATKSFEAGKGSYCNVLTTPAGRIIFFWDAIVGRGLDPADPVPVIE